MEDRDPRFRHLETKVGLLVLLTMAGIVAVIVLIGVERDVFTKKFRIHFIAESGTGLIEGMPVKLSGFRVGRVKELELADDARVRVTLEINKRYRKWIRRGSMASLVKEGFIGEAVVEISVGEAGAEPLPDGGFIPFEKAGGIEELVARAKPVLVEVKDIIHYANDPDGDLKTTVRNMRLLTSELLDIRAEVTRTLAEIRKTFEGATAIVDKAGGVVDRIDREAAPVVESVSRVVANVESASEELGPVIERVKAVARRTDRVVERLPEVERKVEAVIDNIKRISDVVAGESARIREILVNMDEAAAEGKEAVKGVRRSWPLRLMMPPVEEPSLIPFDSFAGHGR